MAQKYENFWYKQLYTGNSSGIAKLREFVHGENEPCAD